MNYNLLTLLQENNDYISGEDISKKFGISRAAIWKQINALKNKGYVIEGISNKGYKLISTPDILVPTEVISRLKTRVIGKTINYSNSTKSTNEDAKLLASKGAEDGTIVISEEQLGGKGRLGRIFHSPKGGIYVSLILRPNFEPIYASKITQLLAASLYNALDKLDIKTTIKWPNDLYINGKKISGILTEMKCDMDRIDYVIAGIGINVNISEDEFPKDLKNIATSLEIELGKKINRIDLLTNLLEEFERLYDKLVDNNDISEVIDICKKGSLLIGKDAYHITSRGSEPVTCIGLSDDGELIVKDSAGVEKKIISGEITFKKNI